MSSIASSFLPGFVLSLSLILAIGAQNAFVLRYGLRRLYVLPIVLTCAISDAMLIAAGVAGFGSLSQMFPWVETAMRYGGAAFLLWYGWLNARSAWVGGAALAATENADGGLRKTLLTLVALTFLNPHVYVDTVVLIGSVSAQYEDRFAFGAGAVLGSFCFFFALGYGARLLSPVFARPGAWRVLDAVIAITMWSIAASLII